MNMLVISMNVISLNVLDVVKYLQVQLRMCCILCMDINVKSR